MSSRPFFAKNPADIAIGISPDGTVALNQLNQPIWKTPPKASQLLWCEYESDARWYLHLGELARQVPPIPTLNTYLRYYEKMGDEEVFHYLNVHDLAEEYLEQEFDDPLWELTWHIRYSPLSQAYDFLWERDIPNKSPFCDQLLFEQDNGLAVMPRQVSTDDIFCLQALQAELYEEGVALVVA